MARGYRHLTYGSRCQIYALRKSGESIRGVARLLGVSASTAGRELRRNSGLRGCRMKQAQRLSEARRRQASSRARKLTGELRGWIEGKLRLKWSPDQIAGRLRLEGGPSVGKTWIYRQVWEDRASGGTLRRHLRRRGRNARRRSRCDAGRGGAGSDTGPGGHFTAVGGAVLACLGPVSALARTLTVDNGKEFAGHREVAAGLSAGFFFARPHRSWERGPDEHTNGLVRQYFPKAMAFTGLDDARVRQVQDLLNGRPRQVLGYRTPAEVFGEVLKEAGAPKAFPGSAARAGPDPPAAATMLTALI